MTPKIVGIVITNFLKKITERIEEATQIAKAAETCAEAGNASKAVDIVMDVEDPIAQATTLLSAATLLEPDSSLEIDES
jgi:benzoyl-CoA reductase/2-hydroxyglutaryl-CoA dehydratase subunit BcrC/BadD/HgdB